MSGQVDQDVNAVVVNSLGQNFVGNAERRLPVLAACLDTFAGFIELRMIRVGNEFQATMGLGCQGNKYAFQEIAYGVLAQTCRYEPDAQTACRIGDVIPA